VAAEQKAPKPSSASRRMDAALNYSMMTELSSQRTRLRKSCPVSGDDLPVRRATIPKRVESAYGCCQAEARKLSPPANQTKSGRRRIMKIGGDRAKRTSIHSALAKWNRGTLG
jgi:hypothetical protein